MLEHSQENYGREPAQPPPVLSNINVSVTGQCHASSMLHPDTQSHLAAEISNASKIKLTFSTSALVSVGGIMVSIAAFQAVDPGSIPGRRNFFPT